MANWLQSQAPKEIKQIQLIFPIVGHSYLPSDRVFGRIEKVIRTHDVIVNPKEYNKIFSLYGTVRHLGTDFPVLDWKTAVGKVLKPPRQWHFRFAPTKRIMFSRSKKGNVLVQGEVHYNSNSGTLKSILKKGTSVNSIDPQPLQNEVPVKPLKLQDVDKLLKKHYGDEWRALEELSYYSKVIDAQRELPVVDGIPEANDQEEISFNEDVQDYIV